MKTWLMILCVISFVETQGQSFLLVDSISIDGNTIGKISNTTTPSTVNNKTLYTSFAIYNLFNTHATIVKLKSDVTKLQSENATLKKDNAIYKTDIAAIKSSMAKLQTDVTKLKTDSVEIFFDRTKLEWKWNKLKKRIDIVPK